MTSFPISEILRRCENGGVACSCFYCEFARKLKYEQSKEAELHRATLAKQEWVEQRREFYDE